VLHCSSHCSSCRWVKSQAALTDCAPLLQSLQQLQVGQKSGSSDGLCSTAPVTAAAAGGSSVRQLASPQQLQVGQDYAKSSTSRRIASRAQQAECQVCAEGLQAACGDILAHVRLHFPRFHFVEDQALLRCVALADSPADLAAAVLARLFPAVAGFLCEESHKGTKLQVPRLQTPLRPNPHPPRTVNGNAVRSLSTHGQQSAAKGGSTTVSRSGIGSIQ
jgi:hypothetical protein